MTVVSLQYLTPLILTLNCTLLLKSLGERGGAGGGAWGGAERGLCTGGWGWTRGGPWIGGSLGQCRGRGLGKRRGL